MKNQIIWDIINEHASSTVAEIKDEMDTYFGGVSWSYTRKACKWGTDHGMIRRDDTVHPYHYEPI